MIDILCLLFSPFFPFSCLQMLSWWKFIDGGLDLIFIYSYSIIEYECSILGSVLFLHFLMDIGNWFRYCTLNVIGLKISAAQHFLLSDFQINMSTAELVDQLRPFSSCDVVSSDWAWVTTVTDSGCFTKTEIPDVGISTWHCPLLSNFPGGRNQGDRRSIDRQGHSSTPLAQLKTNSLFETVMLLHRNWLHIGYAW